MWNQYNKCVELIEDIVGVVDRRLIDKERSTIILDERDDIDRDENGVEFHAKRNIMWMNCAWWDYSG